MGKKRFRKKYFLALFASPLTLFPIAGGVTLFCILGALGKISLACLTLILGLFSGFGTFFTRAFVGSEKIARRVQEEIEREDHEVREIALDKLEKQLTRDKDHRTEAALRDLRALADTFKREYGWKDSVKAHSTTEVLSLVDRIFKQCVKSLKATLKIYQTIRTVESDAVRTSLSSRRNAIVQKVQENVKKLVETLEQIQELSVSDDQEGRLSKLGEELTRQLEIAKRIDERTKSLDQKIQIGSFEEDDEDRLGDLEF